MHHNLFSTGAGARHFVLLNIRVHKCKCMFKCNYIVRSALRAGAGKMLIYDRQISYSNATEREREWNGRKKNVYGLHSK